MSVIFTASLTTSVIGTVLALIITLVRPLTRKVFSPTWHYYIWLAVLIVMLCPFKFNLAEKTAVPEISESITETNERFEYDEFPSVTEQSEGLAGNSPSQEGSQTTTEKSSVLQSIHTFLSTKALIFSLVWITGAVLLFLIKTSSYLTFLIKVRKYSRPTVCSELEAYTSRNVRVRVSSRVCSPILIGEVRPTLLLPDTVLTPDQLKYVLSHEVTHLKRHDILFKWLVLIVKCIHWFNPAIYFIARQINVDCEISCDSAVTSKMDEKSKKEYAETILALITKGKSKTYPLSTGMTGSKKTLKRRFTMLKSKLKFSKKALIISVIAAVLLSATALIVSGIVNGYFYNENDNTKLDVVTDEVTEKDFNLLFVGTNDDKYFDTIILFKVQSDGIKGIGIPLINPRLMYQPLRNLPHTHGENADQILIDTVKDALDIPVHYYVKMELSAAEKIIDSVDGIYYDVPMDMSYGGDPSVDPYIDLKKGTQHLSGKEACDMLRYACYPKLRIDRTNFHMEFIKVFLEQKFTVENIAKAPEIFEIIADNVKTNYHVGNLEHDLKIIAALADKNYTYEMLPPETEFPLVTE